MQVVELERRAVVVLVQRAEPVQVLVRARSVQQVHERGRSSEVFVDGEGHLVIEVECELEPVGARHSHRVVHADLVQLVARKYRVVGF